MFTVAIIGPDGAGKSTVVQSLEQGFPYPMRRIYMGMNPDSWTHVLPTTRLAQYLKRRGRKPGSISPERQAVDAQKMKQEHPTGRHAILQSLKTVLFLVNRFSEAWYRQAACWYYLRRGYIVLFDRHFYLDHLAFSLAHPNAQRPFLRRIYDGLLEKTYPRPDLTIYLDAPAEVLFARKHESTIEALQQMREAYLNLEKHTSAFHVVDTVQSPEKVLEAVEYHIRSYREARRQNVVPAER